MQKNRKKEVLILRPCERTDKWTGERSQIHGTLPPARVSNNVFRTMKKKASISVRFDVIKGEIFC